mmetsp:Transcript_12890/g.25512  ORF Transcript_12890/g.25512 Transcript_12890/m.25512 type:complete len:93 (-) Transcript_12890:112-390(-)
MQNFLIRVVSTLAPLIHKGIVDRLANSPTFQRVAWEGTEAAKRAAERGIQRAKAAGIIEDVTPKMMQEAARRKAAAAQAGPGPIEKFLRKFM